MDESRSFVEYSVKQYPKQNMKNLMKGISDRKSFWQKVFLLLMEKNLNDIERDWIIYFNVKSK